MEMREVILEKLKEIERQEHCRILFAGETGSRAWGFASPDSDYDVRFVYIRPRSEYLRLDPIRDVIECPISDQLDISGWDLTKTLRLTHRSNPTILEWLASPEVYRSSPSVEPLGNLALQYLSRRKSIRHYSGHAAGYMDRILSAGETADIKMYLYALRSVLACHWILDRGTFPPVPIGDLMDAELDEALRPTVEDLLARRTHDKESRIPAAPLLQHYLESSLAEIDARTRALSEEEPRGWEELNAFFLAVLEDEISG